MKKIVLVPAFAGIAAAIMLFALFSQESISKNIGLEKEHYELGFVGVVTYNEDDLVKIRMLLSGHGTDCASAYMEIQNADGDTVEKNGHVVDCTRKIIKELESKEVLAIEARLPPGNYFVHGIFSPEPGVQYTKIENFTVAKQE